MAVSVNQSTFCQSYTLSIALNEHFGTQLLSERLKTYQWHQGQTKMYWKNNRNKLPFFSISIKSVKFKTMIDRSQCYSIQGQKCFWKKRLDYYLYVLYVLYRSLKYDDGLSLRISQFPAHHDCGRRGIYIQNSSSAVSRKRQESRRAERAPYSTWKEADATMCCKLWSNTYRP